MKGSTLNILQVQWGRAMLDGDFQKVDRIDAAREALERLPQRRLTGCVWAGTETCRTCPLADTCPTSTGAA